MSRHLASYANPFGNEDDDDRMNGHGRRSHAHSTSNAERPRGGARSMAGGNPFDGPGETDLGGRRNSGTDDARRNATGGARGSRSSSRDDQHLRAQDVHENLGYERGERRKAGSSVDVGRRSKTPPPSNVGEMGTDAKSRKGQDDYGFRSPLREVPAGPKGAPGGGKVASRSATASSSYGAHTSSGDREGGDENRGPLRRQREYSEQEQLAINTMTDTSRTIERCQEIANNTLDIASDTLVTLHKQGEQIQRTHETAVRIDQELTKGESLVGRLGPMFGFRWKPKKGKAINGPVHLAVPAPMGAMKAGEDTRARQELGLDRGKKSGGGVDDDDPAGGTMWAKHGTEFRGYEEEKAMQDDGLDALGSVVEQLKSMSTAMGQEMDRQSLAIDHLDGDLQELHNRSRGATKRLTKLLRK